MPRPGLFSRASATMTRVISRGRGGRASRQGAVGASTRHGLGIQLAVDLLGRVVEAASGKRLADFLAQRLFEPLKMQDTAFWVPGAKMGRVAQPLAVDFASGQPTTSSLTSRRSRRTIPGGAAVC